MMRICAIRVMSGVYIFFNFLQERKVSEQEGFFLLCQILIWVIRYLSYSSVSSVPFQIVQGSESRRQTSRSLSFP